MYCPNCKEHSDDKYCPKCGTMLIDEPQTAGLTFGVGDGTAINGSINVAHTDSHNSYDQRVINTSNVSNTITNIQERQKSEIELMQERKNLFFNACKRAYEDNILEQEELIQLESYRVELGLKKDEADRLLDKVRELVNRNATKSELTGIAKIKLKQLSEALKRNEIPALMQQIDSFEALASKFTNDELQYKYFLVLSALKPEKCIEKCEALKADNYWKSYWSCLAYRKIGNTVESDKTLMDLEAFDTFPEDNTLLLGAACALIDGKAAEATDYLTSVVGEFSPALQRFADSIYYIADPAIAQELDVKEEKCAFYLVNFFNHQIVDKAAEEEARRKAEAEAKHKAEEAAQRKAEAEAKRKAETEAKRKAEEVARHKAEAEAKRKAEEAAQRKAEAEAKRKAEEVARHKAEAEAKRKAEEAAQRKAEAEAKRKAEETAQRKIEAEAHKEVVAQQKKERDHLFTREGIRERMEAKRRAEEEARRKAEEEKEKKDRILYIIDAIVALVPLGFGFAGAGAGESLGETIGIFILFAIIGLMSAAGFHVVIKGDETKWKSILYRSIFALTFISFLILSLTNDTFGFGTIFISLYIGFFSTMCIAAFTKPSF